MLNGRFVGTVGDTVLELRADLGVPGGLDRVSGDLFSRPPGEERRHVAHLLTPSLDPGASAIDSDVMVANSQVWTGGHIELVVQADGSLKVDLRLDRHDAASGDRLVLDAARVDDKTRTLRLRPFVTPGVEPPDSPQLEEVHTQPASGATDGPRVSFSGALEQAGLGVVLEAAQQLAATGGDDSWSDAELHSTLADLVALNPAGAEPGEVWDRPLLVVPRSERSFVLGITFATGEPELGRVSAVFFEGVREHDKVGDSIEFAREYLFTCIHETAHILGLPHAWEPLLGIGEPQRWSGSLTFTNYPHLYRLGGYHAFYRKFAYHFQDEELLQLRHGAWTEVFPGTVEEHSEIDLLLAPGGSTSPHPGLKLELRSSRGGEFLFAEPVQLEARLTNRSRRRLVVPRDALDPEGGRLAIYVSGPGQRGRFRRLVPLLERTKAAPRCTLGVRHRQAAEPSYSMYETVNPSYGRSGFTFLEPGTYWVRAVVLLDAGYKVESADLEVRIGRPSAADESGAADVLTPEVGRALVLGGDPLSNAARLLERVVESQRPRGLVSWAAYQLAETASRDFKRPLSKVRRLIPADPQAALDLLGRVTDIENWPNQRRSRFLQLRGRCHAALGRAEEAEKAVAELSRLVEDVVRTNRPLHDRLLREVGGLRKQLRQLAAEVAES